MLNKIEIKLIDDKGNYSIAHVDYGGYVEMFTKYDINMVHDALQAMVKDFDHKGRLDIKKDAIAEHEKFGAPHKH